MSYTIYFSVTRFNLDTFAYASSQGKEGAKKAVSSESN